MLLQSVQGRFIAVLIGCFFLPLPVLAQIREPQDFDSLDPGSQKPTESVSSPDLEHTSERIATLTNQFRTQQGRGALTINPRLSRTAQDFADYLARTDTFSHTADGKRPSQRIHEHDYPFCFIAENIGWEYNSADFTTAALAHAFVTGWRHSSGHRRNMLDTDLDEIGVGVARSTKTGRYYAVQDFGRPQARAIVFRITNETDSTIQYTVDGKSFSLDPHYTVTHQRCRTPELDFQEARDTSAAEKEGEETFHPRNGDHFTVRGDRESGYTAEKK
jgi:uncharacterized protein YkwD